MAVNDLVDIRGGGESGGIPKVKKARGKEEKNYSKLPEATQSYFNRVEVMLDADDFEDEDDKMIFIGNVFDEIKKQELLLAFDQECSRILEKLLLASHNYHLRQFMTKLSGNYIKLCTNRYGSHVLQTLLALTNINIDYEHDNGSAVPELFRDSDKGDEGTKCRELKGTEELFVEVCIECEEHMDTMINNGYASHVFRMMIAILSGTALSDDLVRSKRSQSYQGKIKHEQGSSVRGVSGMACKARPSFLRHFNELVKRIGEVLSAEGKLREFATSPTGSPVLQALLLALKTSNTKQMKLFINQLMSFEGEVEICEEPTEGDNNDSPSKTANMKKTSAVEGILIRDAVGSHLMEKILHVMGGDKQFMKDFYKTYLATSIEDLACDPISNFVVQHFIANLTDVSLFKEIAAGFKGAMENILASGNLGVVVKLTDGCVRFQTSQKRVMKALVKAFHCPSKAKKCQLSRCLMHYMTQDLLGDEKDLASEIRDRPLSLQGAIILQNLFAFKESENELAVSSLMRYDKEAMQSMARHVNASRVLEAFFKGTASPKLKVDAFRFFKGSFAEMAMDKYASRVLEVMWKSICLIDRRVIADEIIKHEEAVKSSFSGRFVFRNFALDKYKLQYNIWVRIQNGESQKRDFSQMKESEVEDIVNEATAMKGEAAPKHVGDDIDVILSAIKESKGAEKPRKKKAKRDA